MLKRNFITRQVIKLMENCSAAKLERKALSTSLTTELCTARSCRE